MACAWPKARRRHRAPRPSRARRPSRPRPRPRLHGDRGSRSSQSEVFGAFRGPRPGGRGRHPHRPAPLEHRRHPRGAARGGRRSDRPALAAAAADVLAFHRIALPDIRRLLGSEDPGVRVLAFGALGRLGQVQEPDLASALESESAELRRAALEAAARSGLPDFGTTCRRAASRQGNPDAEALAFLGVLGDPADLSVLQAALGQPGLAGGGPPRPGGPRPRRGGSPR